MGRQTLKIIAQLHFFARTIPCQCTTQLWSIETPSIVIKTYNLKMSRRLRFYKNENNLHKQFLETLVNKCIKKTALNC